MDRRSVMVPPEMTNGSSSGSVSSNSSARAIRIGNEVEEMQLTATACQEARCLALQHDREQAVARIQEEKVQCPLRARAVGGRILFEWELKEGVELDGRAAAD